MTISEQPLFQDDLVTVTADQVVAGGASYPVAAITEMRIRGGTGIEEKIFLSLIAFFGLGIAVVGLLLQDRGELLLGLGLAAVTIWIVCQKCDLVLVTERGKQVLLRHRDVVYVRKLRNVIDEAIEACRPQTGS